jgi:hypothetical protein
MTNLGQNSKKQIILTRNGKDLGSKAINQSNFFNSQLWDPGTLLSKVIAE